MYFEMFGLELHGEEGLADTDIHQSGLKTHQSNYEGPRLAPLHSAYTYLVFVVFADLYLPMAAKE